MPFLTMETEYVKLINAETLTSNELFAQIRQ